MIYTITLNPAIDRVLKFDEFNVNFTNRAFFDHSYAAGKGIHVSKLLSNIGVANVAIYVSGQNDDWFENDLTQQNIKYKKVVTNNGAIRQNLKLIDNNSQTECNGLGIAIDDDIIKEIVSYLNINLKREDIVVISGSLPRECNNNMFFALLDHIKKIDAKIILDLSDTQLLLESLKFQPFLIKPNLSEHQDIVKQNITKNDLLKLGAQNIFISEGPKGGTLISHGQEKKFRLSKSYKAINEAGAGDSFVGGFIAKITDHDIIEAIKYGLACGTATAISDTIANKETIEKVKKELTW